jgi:hypothetical protein
VPLPRFAEVSSARKQANGFIFLGRLPPAGERLKFLKASPGRGTGEIFGGFPQPGKLFLKLKMTSPDRGNDF